MRHVFEVVNVKLKGIKHGCRSGGVSRVGPSRPRRTSQPPALPAGSLSPGSGHSRRAPSEWQQPQCRPSSACYRYRVLTCLRKVPCCSLLVLRVCVWPRSTMHRNSKVKTKTRIGRAGPGCVTPTHYRTACDGALSTVHATCGKEKGQTPKFQVALDLLGSGS